VQRLDLLVALPGAFDQPTLLSLALRRLDGELIQIGRRRRRGRHGSCRFGQAAVVAGHDLLDVLGQVVPQVEAVRDLDRIRCSGAGAFGVGARPVAADHLNPGMRLQPRGEGAGLPVGPTSINQSGPDPIFRRRRQVWPAAAMDSFVPVRPGTSLF